MKKFLLGTTMLISVSAASAAYAGGSHAPAAAAPANTGGLTVMVGGNYNFQSANIDQDIEAATQRGNSFRNDTTINVTAAGSTDSFDYGAVVELIADSSANNAGATGNKNGDIGGNKTYLYIENDSFGRFEAGQNVGAQNTLEVDASRIARGTGGINGDWVYGVNPVATAGSNTLGTSYLVTPNLPTGDEDTDAGLSNKITYYTPRFSGFQAGITYSPDTGNRGSATPTPLTGQAGQFEGVIAGGVNFESDIADGVGLMASIVGVQGNAEVNTVNDLSAYSLGLGLEFEGFSVAGSWADLGDSGVVSTATVNDESEFWTLGAAYENGPYGVSVTYLDSTLGTGVAAGAGNGTGENELTNLVVGADYQMAPGLVPYVEASFFDLEAGSTTATFDNSGTAVLVGANLAF